MGDAAGGVGRENTVGLWSPGRMSRCTPPSVVSLGAVRASIEVGLPSSDARFTVVGMGLFRQFFEHFDRACRSLDRPCVGRHQSGIALRQRRSVMLRFNAPPP